MMMMMGDDDDNDICRIQNYWGFLFLEYRMMEKVQKRSNSRLMIHVPQQVPDIQISFSVILKS
jgi:hypothetical protein